MWISVENQVNVVACCAHLGHLGVKLLWMETPICYGVNVQKQLQNADTINLTQIKIVVGELLLWQVKDDHNSLEIPLDTYVLWLAKEANFEATFSNK